MSNYVFIDHTADVGIKAKGKTLAEAFENAAYGMFDLITDNSVISSVGQYYIELDAPDLEQLLVDWLSKLLFLNGARNLVFGSFNVTIENTHLSATIAGEEYDLKKHRQGAEIKAVTYHMLEVVNKEPYSVQVLFDI